MGRKKRMEERGDKEETWCFCYSRVGTRQNGLYEQ